VLSLAWGHFLEYLFFALVSRHFANTHFLSQFLMALRAQVAQGNMTQQQAMERFAMMQASSPPSFPEQSQYSPGSPAGGLPGGTAQAQHHSPQQPQQAAVSNGVWQQMQYRQLQHQQLQQQQLQLHQLQQQQQQQLQLQQLQQQQQQQRQLQQQQAQQQAQQSGGEPTHGGVMSLSAQQQQVCLSLCQPPLFHQLHRFCHDI
jgi:hypothetical protein